MPAARRDPRIMPLDEALTHIHKRVEATLKKGKFPKDIVAMVTVRVDHHRKAKALDALQKQMSALRVIMARNHCIAIQDWIRIMEPDTSIIEGSK